MSSHRGLRTDESEVPMQFPDTDGRPGSRWPALNHSTPQPPAWGPPPTTPPRHRPRRTIAILAVVLAALALLVAGVGLLATRATDREKAANPALFKEGDCVRPAEIKDRYRPAACSDSAAVGKVIAVVPGGFSAAVAPCPDPSDVVATSSLLQTVCVRNLRGPHPGDPGRGGGVLRPGDCIVDVDRYTIALDPEVACADPRAAFQVLARVAGTARCPTGTHEAIELRGSSLPKVCAKQHRG
jgi:hypothetical protein